MREQLCSAGLRLVRQEIVTANVLAALDYDHERKRALINEKIPRLIRAQFQQFAGRFGTAPSIKQSANAALNT